MKGENFFSELPIDWHWFLIGFVILSIVLWYLYLRYFGNKQKKPKTPVVADSPKEKITFTLSDYEQDRFDSNLFVSPVDSRLTLREITHKNHDLMTLATSWPHLFTNEQLIKIKEMTLEITKLSGDSHEITVTKSPAASFFDFRYKLIGMIFVQLHRQYALRLFRQHFRIKREGNRVINLYFDNGYDYLDDFCDRLQNCQSVLHVIVHDNIKDRKIVLIKDDDRSWWELKKDVLAVAADYFPAGVDWEGDWLDEPEIPNEIELRFAFKGKCELVLSFMNIMLEKRLEKLISDNHWEVVSAHIHYTFSPQKSTLTINFVPEIDYFQPVVFLSEILKKYDPNLNFKLMVDVPDKKFEWSDKNPFTVHINALEELILFMPFSIDPNLLQAELSKIQAITEVSFDYDLHAGRTIKFFLKKKEELSWSDLKTDILAALNIGCPGIDLSLCSWPKDLAPSVEGQN